MKPITAEWVGKAEGDFATVEQEAPGTLQPQLRRRLLPCAAVRPQQCAKSI